jgi:hypothetical protein
MPFGGQSMRQLVHNIMHTTPSIVNPNYSAEIKDACMRMLRKNPKDRPSINSCLAMPLLKSRLSTYLDNYKIHHEFLHTILHGQHILMNKVESKANPAANPPSSPPSNPPSNNRIAKPVDVAPLVLPPPPPVVPKKIINNIRPPLPPAPIQVEVKEIPNKFQKMVDEIRQRELQRDKELNEQRRMIQQQKQQQQRQAENNIIKVAAARNQAVIANRKKPVKVINENLIIAKAKAKVLELQMLAAKEEKEILPPHRASPRQYDKPWLVSPKKPSSSPQVKNPPVKKVLNPSPAPAVIKPERVVKKSPNTGKKKIISPSGAQAPVPRTQNGAMQQKKKPINGWLSELELQMGNLKGQINDIKIAASPKLIMRDSPSTPHSVDESPSLDSYEQGKLPGKNIVNTPTSAPKNKKDVIHSNSPASAVKKKIVPPTEPSNSKVKKSPANAFNESIIDEQIKKEFLLLRKEIREQRSAGFREFIKNQRKDNQKVSPSTMATAVDSDIIVEDKLDEQNDDGVLIIDVEEFTESIRLPVAAPVKVIEPKRLQENEKGVKKTRPTADELKAQREADRIALRELIKNKKKERNGSSSGALDNVEIQVICPQESPHVSDVIPVQQDNDVHHLDAAVGRNLVTDICEESDVGSNIVGDIPLPLPSITFPNSVDEENNLTDAITPPTPFTSEDYVILLDQMNDIVNTSNDLVVEEKDESEFDDGSDTDENIVLDDALLDIELDEIVQHLNSSKMNMSYSLEYNDVSFDSCYSSAHSFDLSIESDSSADISQSSNVQENANEKEDILVETMTSVNLRELLSGINAMDDDTEVIPDDYTGLYSYLNDRLGADVLATALTFLKSISTESNNDDIDDVYLEKLEEIVGSANIGCISLIYSLTLL